MNYEKNIWQAGDVITSEKLNKIEDGVEAASQLAPATVTIPVYKKIGDTDPVFVDNLTANVGEIISKQIDFDGRISWISTEFNASEPSSAYFYGMSLLGLGGRDVTLNFYMPAALPGDADKLIVVVSE